MKINSDIFVRMVVYLLTLLAVLVCLLARFPSLFIPKPAPDLPAASVLRTNRQTPEQSRSNLLQRARYLGIIPHTMFTTQEETNFQITFAQKIRPAVSKWFKTYRDRMPFSLEAVTPDKLVQQFGRDPSNHAFYTFVVDGITLSVEDCKGSAFVCYLNAPRQTEKLMQMPDGSPPILTTPVTKADVQAMLLQDAGVHFKDEDIRMIPSALSGALNGGVIVEVGGDPNNALSWKYNFIFDQNGKLAYYGRGHDAPIK